MRTVIRHAAFLLVLALVAAACGASVDDGGPSAQESAPVATSSATTLPASPSPAVGVLPEGPSALDDMSAAEFPPPLVDPGDIISGGPPPDGIPAIDEPGFLPVADNLTLLPDDEPVVALEIDGDARAYPVRIMIWHEIVNDTVGGVPVSITYCPLCNSAATYGRTINGVETTFGTSGRLFASALVMYDRATESLWTHFDGRAVVGLLTGAELEVFPSPLMAWSDFRTAYPTGQVLDQEQTGHSRRYGANPYTGYDDPDTRPFLFVGDVDGRAVAKQRVVGVLHGDEAKAYTLDLIRSEGPANATNDTIGGEPIVVLWKAGQSSALEGASVSGARDVGTVGVFLSTADGTTLTLEADGDGFRDAETGSSWTITGEAVAGELVGTQLEPLHHLDTFWFAWSTYQPDTSLIESLG